MKDLKTIIENLETCKGWDDVENIYINEAIDLIRQLGRELHESQNALLTQASLIGDFIKQKRDLDTQLKKAEGKLAAMLVELEALKQENEDLRKQNELFKQNLTL